MKARRWFEMGTASRAKAGKEASKNARVQVPPTWAGCRCVMCGKIYNTRVHNFLKTQSHWFKGNDGFLPFCKECTQEMFSFYVKKYGGDEDEAIKRLCMFFDMYYNENLLEYADHRTANADKFSMYTSRANMHQYIGKTFDDYFDEERKMSLANGDTSKSKVTAKMLKFWGDGYEENEYIKLQDEYDELKARHECKTRAQELLFKQIAYAILNCERANKTGDTKKIKEANDNLQSLMGSANIKPIQTNDNALAETNTFGTLIDKWETTKPIPDPAPEWSDVDGIGHYFRTWVLGTILNMFKIKNPYQEEYERDIEKYTAHKPEYDEDDESSGETIRAKIFGNKDNGG